MKTLPTLALLVAVTFTSACNMTDPCTTLGAPTGAEREAAYAGAEVEREIGSTECVVIGDRWVRASSSSDYKPSKTTTKAKPTKSKTT